MVNEESSWKKNPVTLLDHPHILLTEEIDVFLGRLVGTTLQSGELPG